MAKKQHCQFMNNRNFDLQKMSFVQTFLLPCLATLLIIVVHSIMAVNTVKQECLARKLNNEDAVDRSKRMSNDQDGCERVSVSSGTGLPRWSQTKGC